MSLKTFYQVFQKLNLSIYKPRKDECDLCVGHKEGNVIKEIYDEHQLRKEKEMDNLGPKIVFTMDIQGVLLSPYLKASAL